MRETIKRILKEGAAFNFKTKFLIKTFSIMGKWLDNSPHTIEDVESTLFAYEELFGYVESKLVIDDVEDVSFIIASFVLNYMSNGDWDLLDEIGVKEPRKKKWDLRKEYGMSAWVIDEVRDVEGYLPSEMLYADTDGGYNWKEVELSMSDMWDEQIHVDEV